MTREEAEKVAAIFATADGGCADCVHALAKVARKAFPGFPWVEMTDKALDEYWTRPTAADGARS